MTDSSSLKDMTPLPRECLEFFDLWFAKVPSDSLISIVRIQPTSPGALPIVLTLEQVKGAIEVSGLDPLIWDNGTMYDLYYSAVTLFRPEKGRGGLRHVKQVTGVWLDLDVKSGSFGSREEALELLRKSPLSPTAIVSTGTEQNGLHAYWRLDKPVNCDLGRELNLRWWSLISDLAAPASIDKLVDPSRVLRVPGAIRWPKNSNEKVSVSRLLFKQDVSYTKEEIFDWTEAVWAEHQERIARTKARVFQAQAEAHQFVLNSETDENNRWLFYMQLAGVEEMFNETYSWESVLIPLGWTCLGEDEDKRVLWSRPGDGIRKSATTDWPDSPHIMSLFSTAPETGLADLHEGGISLTKYRVWVHLVWGGDEKSAIVSLLQTQK